MKKKNIFNSRKLKYGTVAMVFSIAFVIMVIVANLIFTALDDRFNLKYDMTSEKLFTITEATENLLSDLDTEVSIKFMMPIDKVEENGIGKYVLECAQSYAQKFDNIKLECIDMVGNPALINKYKQNGEQIFTYSLIVESSLRYEVITSWENLLVVNSQGYHVGFNGEMKLTSAIMRVTDPAQPVVTFTQGHGETVPAAMREIFTNAGYIVEAKDISREAVNPATEIIVINNPTIDFFGLNTAKEGGVSEIEWLNDYMNSFRHVMVFLSADNTASLPELEELLATRGVKVNRGSKIKDMGSAVTNDGYMSVATPAGEMYGSVINKDIIGRTIVTNAAPIEILFTDKNVSEDGSFVYTYETTYVDPVLTTTPNAAASLPDGSEVYGPFNTMVLSSKYDYVNNEKQYSHMLVTSSDYFADFIGNNSFGNERLLYNTMTLMGKERVPVNIDYKLFDNTTLEKIDQKAVKTWAIFLIGVIPMTIAVLGFVVWMRRRHR